MTEGGAMGAMALRGSGPSSTFVGAEIGDPRVLGLSLAMFFGSFRHMAHNHSLNAEF